MWRSSQARPGIWCGVLLLCGGPALAGDLPELPADLAGDMPQVLTPARLEQAQIDVGASVTVIDRDMILALGARDIPELLRLVPGMMVVSESQAFHTYSVNYHGTHLSDVRRLQVLIDGMSMYQPAFSRVLWTDLPVSLADIERIEVTRGPNAATYGSNSFSGVVNIITVHPQETAGRMLRVAAGNRDTLDTGGHASGHGDNSDWRWSFSTREDSGFDFDRYGNEDRDDRRVANTSLRSEYRPGDRDRVDIQLGISGSEKQLEDEDFGVFSRFEEHPVQQSLMGNLLGRWRREVSPDHAFQWQAYTQYTQTRQPFRACLLHPILVSDELAALSAVDPDYAVGWIEAAYGAEAAGDPSILSDYIAGLPTSPVDVQQLGADVATRFFALPTTEHCGDVAFDTAEARADIEFQDTLRVNERLRLVSGVGFRYDYGQSDSYLDGDADNAVWRLFGHGEYRVIESLLFNFGAMLEDDRISGITFSPMGALNWRFLPQQALRVVGSRAYRTQDIYEEYASTRISFSHMSPPWTNGVDPQQWTDRDLFLVQTAPGNLKPERIDSAELGYFGYFPATRTEVDVRWFREKLDNLISNAINPANFDADNTGRVELNGIEFQARYRFAPRSWLWGSYAYIDNQTNNVIEGKFTARHSGSLAVGHRFASAWTGSAAWFFTRNQNERVFADGRHADRGLERLDLRLARDFPLGESRLQVSATAQCRFDDEPHVHIDNLYEDRLYGYLGAQLEF